MLLFKIIDELIYQPAKLLCSHSCQFTLLMAPMHRLFILSFCSFYLEATIKKPLHILAKRVIYISQMRLRSSELARKYFSKYLPLAVLLSVIFTQRVSQLALSYTRALLLYLHDESCIRYQLLLFALLPNEKHCLNTEKSWRHLVRWTAEKLLRILTTFVTPVKGLSRR